jgi:kynurenine formamidase
LVRTSAGLDTINEAVLLEACGLVVAGKVIDLGQEISEEMPMGSPGAFTPFSFTWRVTPEGSGRGRHYQYAAETITGALHTGTHIDGLAHVSASGRGYRGSSISEIRGDRGFTRFGMETVPPIITRGVVLDVASLHGVDQLPDGYEIGTNDIDQCLLSAGLDLKDGDAVLVKTGKGREYGTHNDRYQAGQPGVGPDGAIYLYERGMAVLGSDTAGTEPLPFLDETKTTHQEMLVERGVHLIENLRLADVGSGLASVGLFICLPLRITGATGSWVRPVLVV